MIYLTNSFIAILVQLVVFILCNGTFCNKVIISVIKQKGMTFDHDFGYSYPLFSSLLKKEGRIKGE